MKIFRRRRFEAEMDAELRFHLDAYIEDLVRSGIDRASAERRARLEFGSIEANKEECRQAWGFQRLDELRGDVRLAWRMLRQDPRFAAVAILSLALGIGANTAIFGLIDAVMLRVLPVHQPEQLAFVEVVGSEGPNGAPPYPWFEVFRNESTSFEGLAAFRTSDMELTVDGAREQVRGLWASCGATRADGAWKRRCRRVGGINPERDPRFRIFAADY